MRRREIPVEQKLEVVLTVLKGTFSVEEAARHYGVSSQSIHRWKNQFLTGGKEALRNSRRGTSREKQFERELREAKRVIAEQAIALEVLKKIAGEEGI